MPLKRERRPPCRVCGIQRYRPSGAGTLICIRGHVLEGVIEEVADDGFQEAKAAVTRKIQTFGGEAAKVALIRAIQFILRSQVKASSVDFGACTLTSTNDFRLIGPRSMDPSPQHNSPKKSQSGFGTRLRSDSESYANDYSSDTSEGEIIDNIKPSFAPLEYVTLRWTLVLLYLGCQYIRCPVLMVDLIHLATLNQLPYLNPYPQLPAECQAVEGMPLKLTANYPASVSFTPPLASWQRCSGLGLKLRSPYRPSQILHVVFSTTFDYLVKIWFGTDLEAQLYPLLKNMARDAGVDLGVGFASGGKGLPESLVAGLLVIAFKCMYGLDGKSRQMHPAFPNLPPLDQLLSRMVRANQKYNYDLIPNRPKAFKSPNVLKGGFSDAMASFSDLVRDYTSCVKDLALQDLPADVPNLQLSDGCSIRAGDEYLLNNPSHSPHYDQSPECCLLVKLIAMYFLDGDHALLMRSIYRLESCLLHRWS
ncbi:hypothetical protein L0F63_005533, partial [Massospora cicadina]